MSKQSGSAVNELEYNGFLIQERQRAQDLLTYCKNLEATKPKKLFKTDSRTIETEGFRALMLKKSKFRPIFKRTVE